MTVDGDSHALGKYVSIGKFILSTHKKKKHGGKSIRLARFKKKTHGKKFISLHALAIETASSVASSPL
jgi:hypothetical protein